MGLFWLSVDISIEALWIFMLRTWCAVRGSLSLLTLCSSEISSEPSSKQFGRGENFSPLFLISEAALSAKTVKKIQLKCRREIEIDLWRAFLWGDQGAARTFFCLKSQLGLWSSRQIWLSPQFVFGRTFRLMDVQRTCLLTVVRTRFRLLSVFYRFSDTWPATRHMSRKVFRQAAQENYFRILRAYGADKTCWLRCLWLR